MNADECSRDLMGLRSCAANALCGQRSCNGQIYCLLNVFHD